MGIRKISKETPHILFLTNWYPTKENPAGSIFVHEHALALQAAGAKVTIIRIAAKKSTNVLVEKEVEVFEKDGVSVISIFLKSRFSDVVNAAWWYMWQELKHAVKKHLNDETFDYVHSNVIYPAGFLGDKLASELKIPHFVTEHWTNLKWVFGKPYYRAVGKRVYNQAYIVFPVSNYLANQIKEFAGKTVNTVVVPNVVNPNIFRYSERVTDTKTKFLCVTNFWLAKKKSHKRPDVLIEAVKLLPEKLQEKMELTFIGRGGGQEQLKEYLKSLNLNCKITFMGGQPKETISEQMQRADFLLQATERETFGVVIAEAMNTGLPCIVSELDVLKELVNHHNGVLVKSNSPQLWMEALSSAIKGEFQFDNLSISQSMQQRFSYKTIGNMYLDETIPFI